MTKRMVPKDKSPEYHLSATELTRRDFFKASAASIGVISTGIGIIPAAAEPVLRSDSSDSLVDVDFNALVSRSDLWYFSPVETNDSRMMADGTQLLPAAEGQPIGNGSMGTMVWTTPSSIQFHINRDDVFSVNRNHIGQIYFLGGADTDFCGACAGITIDVGGQPFAKGKHFRQHLSLYNAESQIHGDGVRARCFISADSDVLVVEIDDHRLQPQPVQITLSLWGEPSVQIGDHLSRFEFVESGGNLGVVRTFTEKDYYCQSAVAVQATGYVQLDTKSPTERTFRIDPSVTGKTLILISSAAAMSTAVDVPAQAFRILGTTRGQSYEKLQTPHRKWWSGFWSRTFTHMSSPDDVANFMERLRALHLYIMACSSRGKIAPKWNCMLFVTDRDKRPLGSQYWGWTMETIYIALFAAGASDLADPYFNMYVRQLPNAQKAAAQRWNAKGAHFTEISPFDGPVILPDNIGQEYQDLLLGKNLEAAGHLSGETIMQYATGGFTPGGRSTPLSHILSTGARIAMHAWWRYRSTGDTQWLRTHGYPLLKNVAEFYRSYAVRRDDGRYHIEYSNVHESFMGVNDGIIDIAVVRGMVPLATRAAEILGVDADLQAAWREFVGNIAPYTMGSDPESKALEGAVLADDVWSVGHGGPSSSGDSRGDEDPWLTPVFPFEDYTLERRDPEMARIVGKLIDLSPIWQRASTEFNLILGTAVRTPVAVARAGRAEELPLLLSAYYHAFPNQLPNGFAAFEDAGSSIQHLGMINMALQEALMQSVSPMPGEPEVIRVFPAWPKAWEGTFSLVARGGFLVTSTRKSGVIPFIEITSRLGGMCQVRNPWNTPCFLAEAGKKKQPQSGEILRFETKPGKTYQLFPGERPAPIRVAPAPGPQASLAYTQANGTVLTAWLGRNS